MNNKWIQPIVFGLLSLVLMPLATSCNPEAKWETKDVKLTMTINNVSAAFVDCSFSTDKDAYYLIDIMEPWDDYNPLSNQKQFMQLVLDETYAEYLLWRNDLLRDKEFNVAPFSSHSLQYGDVRHFFTGLDPDSDYWVVAFVVDPIELKPVGKLLWDYVKTTENSTVDVHFDYRVKGRWDYIYPVDSIGRIQDHFPYIATTIDSLTLALSGLGSDSFAVGYFGLWVQECFAFPDSTKVRYGVNTVENNGVLSADSFKVGHTYYTGICGYDGGYEQATVYKFNWTGDSCDLYYTDTDSANIGYWLQLL